MNNERRKKLEKAISALEDVEALFSSVVQEESIAYSSIPPQREESADAQLSREVIETLEQVIGDMDDMLDVLRNTDTTPPSRSKRSKAK